MTTPTIPEDAAPLAASADAAPPSAAQPRAEGPDAPAGAQLELADLAEPAEAEPVVRRSADQLAAEVGRWLATPPDLREHPHLKALAQSLGYKRPGTAIYNAMLSPAALHSALAATMAGIVPELPSVLAALVKAAQAGSVRAADTLLRHCREVVRLNLDAGNQGPATAQHLHVHLEDTASVARQLLQTATALLGNRDPNPLDQAVTRALPTHTAAPHDAANRWTTRTEGKHTAAGSTGSTAACSVPRTTQLVPRDTPP
jgi:hypothetical protein